jgi:lipopolysaccharide/colanic/teichoic acid biosynthesis glycosyltransferase
MIIFETCESVKKDRLLMTGSSYTIPKMILDRLAAIILIVPFLFCLPLISFAIVLDSPGSPIFIQERVGANGKRFRLLKFRSMRIDAPNLSTDELRASGLDPITHLGYFLRLTSIDELPQLLNVLRGEMSFVGPRPALPTQFDVLELRGQCGADRLLPGLTGLAQVRGRDDLSVEDKVTFDALYFQEFGLLQDLRILLLETPSAVLSRRGNR